MDRHLQPLTTDPRPTGAYSQHPDAPITPSTARRATPTVGGLPA